MKWMKVQWFKLHSKARSQLSLTHLPLQPLSRVKSLDGPRVRVISPVVKEKVYGGKDLLKSQVLSSEWNTERVREDASGDSEDGEDDEMPCVIGESAGDCAWRGSRRSVGSSFHREGKTRNGKKISDPRKINAILLNIKLNLPKLVSMCGYKMATNWQNFTEIYFT